MATRFREALRESKDATLGVAARAWLDSRLEGIGEITSLSIDTESQTIRTRLRLSGDAKPMVILVRKYALRRKGDRAMLTVIDASASRRWVTAVLRQLVTGRTLQIPRQVATALKLFT